jgi:hypothetical protein
MIREMNRLLCIFTFLFSNFAIAQGQATNTSNMSRMYGEIALTNNYVDRGLTQSDKAASVYAGAGYWFGNNGRIAFGANSVNYAAEDANVEIRLLGEFKFNFSALTSLKIRNDFVRYFPADKRNRIEMSLDLDVGGNHLIVLRDDNFDGTGRVRTWYAFHRNWVMGTSTSVDTTAGYSTIPTYSSFFDTRLGLNYVSSNMTYTVAKTYVSAASQFNGRAEMMFFAIIAAKF